MGDVFMEVYLRKKFKKGLKNGLLLRAWVKKFVQEMET